MIILASTAMPTELRNKLPFANKSIKDTPIYDKSIFCLNIGLKQNFELNVDDITMIGVLPFVNTKISNHSEHESIRGKTFLPDVYYGFKRPFSGGNLLRHDALFLNNATIETDLRIETDIRGLTFDSKAEEYFVEPGKYRPLTTDFYNPVRRGNYLSGVNMHWGPGSANQKWNYSLGCVTVEPKTFKNFMKEIPKRTLIPYIHHIDELKHTRRDKVTSKLFNIKVIDDIYSVINAYEFKEVK